MNLRLLDRTFRQNDPEIAVNKSEWLTREGKPLTHKLAIAKEEVGPTWIVSAVFPTPPSPKTTNLYRTILPAMAACFCVISSPPLGHLAASRQAMGRSYLKMPQSSLIRTNQMGISKDGNDQIGSMKPSARADNRQRLSEPTMNRSRSRRITTIGEREKMPLGLSDRRQRADKQCG